MKWPVARSIAIACLLSSVLVGGAFDPMGLAWDWTSVAEASSKAGTDGDAAAGEIYDSLAGSSAQFIGEYKDDKYATTQHLDLRTTLWGWDTDLDVSLATSKASRMRLTAKRSTAKQQVDIGYLTESTPFDLVIPRSGVTGVRVRAKADPLSIVAGSAFFGLLPNMRSPYARVQLLAGEVEGQVFAGGWLYEPRCSIGAFVPTGHDELLICSLHQLPAGFGSIQTAARLGSEAVLTEFAYKLKARIQTALGTTHIEIGDVPSGFSDFVADLGDNRHAWSTRRISHTRRYPIDLSLSWSHEVHGQVGLLERPPELRTTAGLTMGTPDYDRVDASISLTNRDFVSIEDGSGFERQAGLNASIDYLWDYKPCSAGLSILFRNGESASLPDYPGYRGWFEKRRTQLTAGGSFSIYTYLGQWTLSARHAHTLTTRLDETNLRFTAYDTLTSQTAIRWDCIPIEPWTAANVTLSLKDYQRMTSSCTGGEPDTPGASELSHSPDGYRSVSGTISSRVRLPSSIAERTLTLSGTVEYRHDYRANLATPVLVGKVIYNVKL